ncbi:hypothetical protein MTO96_011257 [Rhipicephalus appendiculatus]
MASLCCLGRPWWGGGSQLVLGQLQPLQIEDAPLMFAPVTSADGSLVAAPSMVSEPSSQQEEAASPLRPEAGESGAPTLLRTVTQTLKVRWLDELLEHKAISCPIHDCPFTCVAITAMEKHYSQCTGVNGSGLDQCPYCEAQFLTHSSALHVHIVEQHPTRRSLMHSHVGEGRYRKTLTRRTKSPMPPPKQPTLVRPTAVWDWEQRRRTYSRSWGEPMGPTSELFRRPGSEEEDPLQLPRSVINRSEITLSSEELALDEYQLQQVASAATATAGGSAMNPMEDDTSSTALGPAVPTTEGSLAEAAGAPVSSNIPPPAPRQPLPSEFDVQGAPTQPQHSSTAASLPMPDCLQALASQSEADRRALMQDFETRFAARLLSLETTLAQRTSTADDVVADLAARVSVIEAQSGRQQRVSTSVEQNVPMSPQSRFFRAQLPPPTFDATTSWATFLVQFESVAALNGWTVQDKAQVLVVQLRAAAAEYLEYIPQVIRSNYEALVSALKTRFGDRHLLQLYLTQLKHVQQGWRDLQELAAHVDSLSRKALSGCPTATVDLIAANSFVDAINNRNVQRFVRLARPTDVPSALAIALQAEIQEHSQAAEDPYRRPTYTDVPSGAQNSPARLHEPSAMLRCYHCNDVGHFARNCPGMSESPTNSAARAKFPLGNYNADRRGQDPA